jgi:hypothetical protein
MSVKVWSNSSIRTTSFSFANLNLRERSELKGKERSSSEDEPSVEPFRRFPPKPPLVLLHRSFQRRALPRYLRIPLLCRIRDEVVDRMPHGIRIRRKEGSVESRVWRGIAGWEKGGGLHEEVTGGVDSIVLCSVGSVLVRLHGKRIRKGRRESRSEVTGRTLKVAIALLPPFIVGPSTPLIAMMMPTKNAGTSVSGCSRVLV